MIRLLVLLRFASFLFPRCVGDYLFCDLKEGLEWVVDIEEGRGDLYSS
jgi:hypothetical protein